MKLICLIIITVRCLSKSCNQVLFLLPSSPIPRIGIWEILITIAATNIFKTIELGWNYCIKTIYKYIKQRGFEGHFRICFVDRATGVMHLPHKREEVHKEPKRQHNWISHMALFGYISPLIILSRRLVPLNTVFGIYKHKMWANIGT